LEHLLQDLNIIDAPVRPAVTVIARRVAHMGGIRLQGPRSLLQCLLRLESVQTESYFAIFSYGMLLVLLPVWLCTVYGCRDDQFQCQNTGLCISEHFVCNDHDDCGDMSDELNCSEWLSLLFCYLVYRAG